MCQDRLAINMGKVIAEYSLPHQTFIRNYTTSSDLDFTQIRYSKTPKCRYILTAQGSSDKGYSRIQFVTDSILYSAISISTKNYMSFMDVSPFNLTTVHRD